MRLPALSPICLTLRKNAHRWRDHLRKWCTLSGSGQAAGEYSGRPSVFVQGKEVAPCWRAVVWTEGGSLARGVVVALGANGPNYTTVP